MKLALVSVLLVAACGSSSSSSVVGNRRGGPRPAAVLFIGAGDHRVMEVACWDPATATITGGDACAASANQAVDGKAVVLGDDGARYTLTGRLSDECDASGATMVAAIAPAQPGAGKGNVDVAVAPPEVEVDYRALPPAFDADRKPVAAPLPADVRARIAALATADLASSEAPATITAAQLTVVQVADLDLDGDRKLDRLVSAVVEGGSYAGYVWSGLVLLPGGRLDGATSLWHSDLEMLWVTGSFDLDADGARELVYAGEYYEGNGVGVARIANGVLEIVGSYGCGA